MYTYILQDSEYTRAAYDIQDVLVEIPGKPDTKKPKLEDTDKEMEVAKKKSHVFRTNISTKSIHCVDTNYIKPVAS